MGLLNWLSVKGDKNISIQNVKDATITINTGDASEVKKVVDDIKNWLAQEHFGIVKLLVVATTLPQIEAYNVAIQHLISLDNYGQEPKEWKPFSGGDSIIDLLTQYHIDSSMALEVCFCSDWALDDPIWRANIREFIGRKAIIIIDGIALNNTTNQTFIELFDHTYIGGCIIPICDTYTPALKQHIYQNIERHLQHIHTCVKNFYKQEYTHIELEVKNRSDFFRRITNIAQTCLNKKPQTNVEYSKSYNNKILDNLTVSL